MKRSSEESNISTDRFTTCKTTDRLVYDCLENRGSKVWFCSTFVDQGLDICFGEYTAAGCDRIDRIIIFRIFI